MPPSLASKLKAGLSVNHQHVPEMCYNAYPTRNLNVCYTIPECLLNIRSLCHTAPIYKGPLTRSGHCKQATAAYRSRGDNRVYKLFHRHTPQNSKKFEQKPVWFSRRSHSVREHGASAPHAYACSTQLACGAQLTSTSTKNLGDSHETQST